MGYGDRLQPAYPNNTHKQDWALYTFVGGRGGGGLVATTVSRWSFWIDFDPFDIQNLKMLSKNVDFTLYNDAFGDAPLPLHFIVDQSNDITDELVSANLPTTQGGSKAVGTATINTPPNGFLDNGVTPFSGTTIPPTSSSFSPAPSNVQATGTNGSGTLTIGQTYYYVVTAINSSNVETIASNVASFTPSAIYPSVAVTWDNVPGATAYNVYRNTSPTFTSGSLQIANFVYPGQPPYYVQTTFTSQPTNNSYRNDQGNYTLQGYQGVGYGYGGTNMVCQGFVPQQSQLTGIFFGSLFHTNTTDHTKFYDINVELWDSNKTFIQHIGTIHPQYTQVGTANLSTDASVTGICNNITYNIGDDGNAYWITLNQPTLKLNTPIPLTPGQTYYLVVRQATLSSTNYNFLGMNVDNNSARSTYYYYPFASAYTAADGSSTWSKLVDANGKDVTFPFLTQGNVGRYAVTYWWADIGAANAYWAAPPTANDYTFLHVDYNQKI